MTTANYTRDIVSGGYDINNPDDRDVDGHSVTLAQRIEAVFPTHEFSVKCDANLCVVEITPDLDTAEQQQLDDVVAAHKSASTPDPFVAGCPACIPVYTKATLCPNPNKSGSALVVVSNGGPSGEPVLAFHYNGSWRTSDGSPI